VYLILAIACALAALVVFATLSGGLTTPPLSMAAWRSVVSNRKIHLLLFVTSIFVAGQFVEYPFIAAELKSSLGASPQLIAVLFAVYGLSGVLGSTVCASAIDRFGAPATTSVGLVTVIVGLALWSGGAGSLAVATAGLIVWGMGGGPAISGQQARIIAADPAVASAAVALNTSVLYAGQGIGTTLGGQLLIGGHTQWIGPVSISLVLCALLASTAARRKFGS
jgi:predicted MFS family arabinose efflux permease